MDTEAKIHTNDLYIHSLIEQVNNRMITFGEFVARYARAVATRTALRHELAESRPAKKIRKTERVYT